VRGVREEERREVRRERREGGKERVKQNRRKGKLITHIPLTIILYCKSI
jgi:predicted N-acyltransferase